MVEATARADIAPVVIVAAAPIAEPGAPVAVAAITIPSSAVMVVAIAAAVAVVVTVATAAPIMIVVVAVSAAPATVVAVPPAPPIVTPVGIVDGPAVVVAATVIRCGTSVIGGRAAIVRPAVIIAVVGYAARQTDKSRRREKNPHHELFPRLVAAQAEDGGRMANAT